MSCTAESGTCPTCQSACTYKPGWFLPGEAERVADYLGVSLAELFRTKLAVDWWEGGSQGVEQDTFLLAPALVGEFAGEEYPGDPKGVCVFYENERCTIHPVKPFECAAYVCTDDEAVRPRHRSMADAWSDHQDQIAELLGREPEASAYEGGILGLLGGWG